MVALVNSGESSSRLEETKFLLSSSMSSASCVSADFEAVVAGVVVLGKAGGRLNSVGGVEGVGEGVLVG